MGILLVCVQVMGLYFCNWLKKCSHELCISVRCYCTIAFHFSQFLVLFLPSVVYKDPFQPCGNHKAESLTASLTDSFATCPHRGHITVAFSLSCCFISGIDCERISEYCAVFRMSENDLHLSLCMHCHNASQPKERVDVAAYCHYDSWHESMPNDGIYREEHQRKDTGDLQCSGTIVIRIHFCEDFL